MTSPEVISTSAFPVVSMKLAPVTSVAEQPTWEAQGSQPSVWVRLRPLRGSEFRSCRKASRRASMTSVPAFMTESAYVPAM